LTVFFYEECAHLFQFLVVRLDIKMNLKNINQSGSSSSKSKQIVKTATTKNQNKCAHSSQKKNLFILAEKNVEVVWKKRQQSQNLWLLIRVYAPLAVIYYGNYNMWLNFTAPSILNPDQGSLPDLNPHLLAPTLKYCYTTNKKILFDLQ